MDEPIGLKAPITALFCSTKAASFVIFKDLAPPTNYSVETV